MEKKNNSNFNENIRRSGNTLNNRLPDESTDFAAEELLEQTESSPMGRLLKIISTLPEIRQEKVLNVRRQLNRGRYNVEERLDATIDKVLEDLLSGS